jgi:hypothetical protein
LKVYICPILCLDLALWVYNILPILQRWIYCCSIFEIPRPNICP